jgi:hypothetical protein
VVVTMGCGDACRTNQRRQHAQPPTTRQASLLPGSSEARDRVSAPYGLAAAASSVVSSLALSSTSKAPRFSSS